MATRKKSISESIAEVMKSKSLRESAHVDDEDDDVEDSVEFDTDDSEDIQDFSDEGEDVQEAKKNYAIIAGKKEVGREDAHSARTAKLKARIGAASKLGVKHKDIKKAFDLDAVRTEEVETLDEISNRKRLSYINKATEHQTKKNLATSPFDNLDQARAARSGKMPIGSLILDPEHESNMKNDPKYAKRAKSISKAGSKLTFSGMQREEVDQAAQNAASIQPKGKADALSVAITHLASMSGDDLTNLVAVLQQNSQSAAAGIPDGTAQKNAASVAMKGAIKEDLDAIFGDQELSEEFKENVSTLFEAAVGARVALIESDLQEAFEDQLNEAISEISNDLVDKIDEYLNYVAESWAQDNEVAIENSLKLEITENFLDGLKTLFSEHYMEIPEDRIDVVEALAEELAETESRLNEQMNENMNLTNTLVEFQKEFVFTQLSDGLNSVDASKFKQLAESVEYEDDESYQRKLSVIREQFFSQGRLARKPNSGLITEEIAFDEDDDTGRPSRFNAPQIGMYMNAITRSVKK
jgi:hypothetical protein